VNELSDISVTTVRSQFNDPFCQALSPALLETALAGSGVRAVRLVTALADSQILITCVGWRTSVFGFEMKIRQQRFLLLPELRVATTLTGVSMDH
jgi:hypothetical protein